jgi:hypothetical protein
MTQEKKQVGAPTVPSAFIAISGEWSQSRHIHVMSIHVICGGRKAY